MAKPLLDDVLWKLIEPLLPPPKQRRFRYPGRKPVPNRAALTGILFVLKTGIPWDCLPKEMGCGSGMTCWRRMRDWQATGLWDKIHRVLLDHLRKVDEIDFSRVVVDRGSVRAVGGGGNRPQHFRLQKKRLQASYPDRYQWDSIGDEAHRGESA